MTEPYFFPAPDHRFDSFSIPSQSIALVVGNGLTIDLVGRQSDFVKNSWNPSKPLSWCRPALSYWPPVPGSVFPQRDGSPFLDLRRFRALKSLIGVARSRFPSASDFDLFVHAIRLEEATGPNNYVFSCWHLAEQYIALSYSYFDLLAATWSLDSVSWVEWLNVHSARIGFAISLNYDRVLERYFTKANINAFRTAVAIETGRVPILKPHGSIDFGPDVQGHGRNIFMRGLDHPQTVLRDDQLLNERVELNIVVPSALTHTRQRQHVKLGYDLFRTHGKNFSQCVMIGVSYCEVDQPEMNEIFDSLEPGCEVIYSNPNPPSAELISAVTSRRLTCVHWSGGPQPL